MLSTDAKVLEKRIRGIIETELEEVQTGFARGYAT